MSDVGRCEWMLLITGGSSALGCEFSVLIFATCAFYDFGISRCGC